MKHNVNQVIELTEEEVIAAVLYWLVNKQDIRFGENEPHVRIGVTTKGPEFCEVQTDHTDSVEPVI